MPKVIGITTMASWMRNVTRASTLKSYFQHLWEPLYAARFANLGNTATIIPLVDTGVDITSTTFTTRVYSASGSSQTATWSSAPSALATPFVERAVQRAVWGTVGFHGPAGIPLVKLNGSSERLTIPDADYWTRASSSFSVIFCGIVYNEAAQRGMLTKYTSAGNQREWYFVIDGGETVSLNMLHPDGTNAVQRVSNAAVSLNTPLHICITHDGGTGATACDNAVVYVNGVSVASTANNAAGYAGMTGGTSVIEVGSLDGSGWNGSSFFGSVYGPTFVQAQLTPAQVLNDYRQFRGAVGLG